MNDKAAEAKLSMKYGWATLQSWANGGFAPRLLLEHWQELAGGWKLILMEYLHPDDSWHHVTHAECAEAMWQAVEAHFCSVRERCPALVHEDLRSTSIFVCKMTEAAWEVSTTDFDWALRAGPPIRNAQPTSHQMA
ncbi:hypothetical protein WJX74_003284 [Apatococcus lobatus]|uniref:Protein kinase domain-containing protein n=1 Tax=Apatococcus lobatus TaxID=904363 RepID=A0AAW1SBA1_9CHLO